MPGYRARLRLAALGRGGSARLDQCFCITVQHTWLPLPAVIDIKPHSDPSSYGANSKGHIPVALVGSPTFDVLLVDDATVRFGDAPTTLDDAPAKRGAVYTR